MILYTYKEKGRISMNIRIKQVEKAKRMIDARDAAIFASVVKEAVKPEIGAYFVPVANAFLDLGRAADCASAVIANLVPNVRKRG
jgi:hypothetical protein